MMPSQTALSSQIMHCDFAVGRRSQHALEQEGRAARFKRTQEASSEAHVLSLGRVDPAPHTQHLLGPFAAIAQNSLLRSFSIVDSLANRQHSCRGSEELAIRFQATPNYFAALRATPSGGRPRTPSYSEPLRAPQSSSKPLRVATGALRALPAANQSY